MTDEQRLDILEEARKIGLYGFSGECGTVALAINQVLFCGKAKIVGAVNMPLYRREDRFVGHVGVRPSGFGDDIRIWDAAGVFYGEDGYDEFLAKGMLDPEDSDYRFESDEEAYDSEIIELSPERVQELLPWCGSLRGAEDPFVVLLRAAEKVLTKQKIKKRR